MRWPWFNNTMVNFADPLTAANLKSWRDEHLLAHLAGGAVWYVLFHLAVIGFARDPLWAQLLIVGGWQAVAWEWWQHEMWDAVCILRGRPAGFGYPWLSALWDALTAMAGAVPVGVLWWVLSRVF